MVSRPSRQLRRNTPEAKLTEIKLIHEEVDHPHRIVLGDIVFKLRRKHRSLSAIRPAHKAGHALSLLFAKKILRQNQFSEKLDFSHSLGLNHACCRFSMPTALAPGPSSPPPSCWRIVRGRAVVPARTLGQKRIGEAAVNHRGSEPQDLPQPS